MLTLTSKPLIFLGTNNIQEMATFYRDVLGFPIREQLGGGDVVAQVNIIVATPESNAVIPLQKYSFATEQQFHTLTFTTDSQEELLALATTAAQNGSLSEPVNDSTGAWVLTLRDPDKNKIIITSKSA